MLIYHIQEKKITDVVLFGVNEIAADFCEKYANKINISFAVTELNDEVISQPLKNWGVETKLFDNKVETIKDSFIVICTKFSSTSTRLRSSGLIEYKDYVYADLAEALICGKIPAVFMGTSLMEQLKGILEQSGDFSKKYFPVYYSEDKLLQPYGNFMAEYEHTARGCGLYIYSICEKSKYHIKIMDKSELPTDCKMISVSDYCFWGYYPQLNSDRDIYSDFFLREFERLPIPYETLAMARIDTNLENMCRKNMSPASIVEALCDEDFYSKKEIEDNFGTAIENIKNADKKADIQIAEYISSNIGAYPANRNLNEWNAAALMHIASQLLALIDLPSIGLEYDRIKSFISDTSGTEIPIYPSVSKHLSLSGINEKTKYKIVTYYNTRFMTYRQYMEYAVDYIYKAQRLLHFIGWKDNINE